VEDEYDRQAVSIPIIEMALLTPKYIILAALAEVRRSGFDLHRNELSGRTSVVDDFRLGIDPEIAFKLSAKQPFHC
jgi:hypothetical protein